MENYPAASSSTNMARWSTLGRRSVRNLTALLKRNGGGGGGSSSSSGSATKLAQQPPSRSHHRLSMLDNNCVAGWTCIERDPAEQKQQVQKLEPSRIRTTVLGCPKRLRASLPPSSRKQITSDPGTTEPVAVAPSPLFEIRRRQQQQQQQQYHRSSSRPHSNLTEQSLSSDDDLSDLLLELDGQQRRLTVVGRRLSSPADLWALFASQWPVAVQSLGSRWRIRLQRSDWPSTCWQTLTSAESAAKLPQLRCLPPDSRLLMESSASPNLPDDGRGCSCECTCRGADVADASSNKTVAPTSTSSVGSQQRIERLEAQVTSIARQLDSRRHRLTELRDECRQLRSARDALRQEHDSRTRETRRMFASLSSDVQRILNGWTAGFEQTATASSSEQRAQVEAELESYRQEGVEVSALLDDVDATTSELREDVLSRRRCRSSPAEVEILALHLSRATQRLASLKNRFPELEARTRDLLRQESDLIANDERRLTDEQQRLESWLRRVKKLTMMLYTFKQLAEAQAKEAEVTGPKALTLQTTANSEDEARRNLLHNITSVCPDHDRRVVEIGRAEAAIERRRRMIREAAALKAEKTLLAAASRLKPVQKPVVRPAPVLVTTEVEGLN